MFPLMLIACISHFYSETVFESLDAGYLEKCGTNMKAPLHGIDMPTQVSARKSVQFITALTLRLNYRNLLTVWSRPRKSNWALPWSTIDCPCLWRPRSPLATGTSGRKSKQTWNWERIRSKWLASVFSLCIHFCTNSNRISHHISDVPNASQLQNITLANTVFYHNISVKRLIQNLGSNFVNSLSAQKIQDSLHHGSKLVVNVIQQLISSIKLASSIILLSMHREPGLNSERTISSGPSLYMKELNEFLQRAWNLHIAPFSDKQITESCGRELAERCIELFVRNLAIIRPISASGRSRLKSDCQHLETALNPIAGDLAALGRPFR